MAKIKHDNAKYEGIYIDRIQPKKSLLLVVCIKFPETIEHKKVSIVETRDVVGRYK
jgi:hypothetical protein